MSIRFRLLTETDVKAVLSMDDLIDTMASALQRFSSGSVVQPVRPTIVIGPDAFFGTMPAYVRGGESADAANSGAAGPRSDADTRGSGSDGGAALGAKLVTVFGGNAARGLHTHLATIMLLDPETGALLALLDGRYITEARTAAVSAVSSRFLARKTAASLAIIGTRRPGKEPPRSVVARAHAAAGRGLEPEQTAPRSVRRGGKYCTGVRRGSDRCPTPARRQWGSDRCQTPGSGGGPRRRGGRRRRRHRPGHLVADAGHRERLGQARRARHLRRRLPPEPARDGSGARRPRAASTSTRAPRRWSSRAIW